MQLIPYVAFDGTCKEAFEFYQTALRGKITFLQTFGESPMSRHMPPDAQHRIMHARLESDGATLMGSDMPPDKHGKPQAFSVAVTVRRAEEADRIFAALSEGGKIDMPMQETYFAKRFGMLTDKFGTPWIINGDLHD
jgi:PhnB protein